MPVEVAEASAEELLTDALSEPTVDEAPAQVAKAAPTEPEPNLATEAQAVAEEPPVKVTEPAEAAVEEAETAPVEEPVPAPAEPVAEAADAASPEEQPAEPAPAEQPVQVAKIVPKEELPAKPADPVPTPPPAETAPVAAAEPAEAPEQPIVVAQAPAEAPPAEAPAAETPPPPPPKEIRQVQIQVWISETNEQGLRDLGNNLTYNRFVREQMLDGTVQVNEQSGSVQQGDTHVFEEGQLRYEVTLPRPDPALFPERFGRRDVDGARAGFQSYSGAGLVAQILRSDYGTLESTFRGIEQKADFDLISKPEVLVVDNGLAQIHAGEQIPYQDLVYTDKGAPQLKVAWLDIGVNLKLQPLIMSDDSVQMTISELGVSSAYLEKVGDLDLPVIAKRSQTGVVLVPNGQTLVVGGLSSRSITKSERRVPIIGALPLIGLPFRGRRSEASNSHLLIFVSPTVVDLRDLTGGAVSALNFWQERRWGNRDRIAKEMQVMQEEP